MPRLVIIFASPFGFSFDCPDDQNWPLTAFSFLTEQLKASKGGPRAAGAPPSPAQPWRIQPKWCVVGAARARSSSLFAPSPLLTTFIIIINHHHHQLVMLLHARADGGVQRGDHRCAAARAAAAAGRGRRRHRPAGARRGAAKQPEQKNKKKAKLNHVLTGVPCCLAALETEAERAKNGAHAVR